MAKRTGKMRASRFARQATLAAILSKVNLFGFSLCFGFLGLHRSTPSTDASQLQSRLQESQLKAVAVSERTVISEELTEATAVAFSRLRHLAANAGLHDVPEGLLQRCCTATKNNVEEAYARLRDILVWRQREGVDRILDNPGAVAAERWYRQLLHYGLTGEDLKGRAVMIEAIGQWDMDELDRAARKRKDSMLQAHVVVCETLLSQAEEVAAARVRDRGWQGGPSARARQRVPGFVAVLDMEGISSKQNPLVYPQLLNALREVSTINARYYPEAVEHVFVVNAPRLFESIWRILSPFVLPSSGVKVDVLSKGEFGPLLRECGRECLPLQLGGILPRETFPYRS